MSATFAVLSWVGAAVAVVAWWRTAGLLRKIKDEGKR